MILSSIVSSYRYLAATATSGGEKPEHIGGDAARLFLGLLVRLAGRRVLLVDEYQRLAGTQALALRLRQVRKGLVHQHHGRHPLLPGCKRVAHGGAGAGPSGADADDEII